MVGEDRAYVVSRFGPCAGVPFAGGPAVVRALLLFVDLLPRILPDIVYEDAACAWLDREAEGVAQASAQMALLLPVACV